MSCVCWSCPGNPLLQLSCQQQHAHSIGFMRQAGDGGAAGVACGTRHQKLPPSPIKPVPPSQFLVQLAKAEPISNAGSTPVTTYLRRGKNCCSSSPGIALDFWMSLHITTGFQLWDVETYFTCCSEALMPVYKTMTQKEQSPA